MTAQVQREARALGDPTRHRLFRYIADAPQSVGVAELTSHVGLNHNAVRQHLAVLKEAGLVTEETEDRSRRGRPRLMYRLHPEVSRPVGDPGRLRMASRCPLCSRPAPTERAPGWQAGRPPTRCRTGRSP